MGILNMRSPCFRITFLNVSRISERRTVGYGLERSPWTQPLHRKFHYSCGGKGIRLLSTIHPRSLNFPFESPLQFNLCSERALLVAPPSPAIAPAAAQKRGISQSFHSNYLSPDCPPIGFAQGILESVHASTGLPWWASIAVATFALRTLVTLPLMTFSLRNVAKVELLQPEVKAIAEELNAEVRHAQVQHKWSSKIAKYHFKLNFKRHVRELYIRDNCHPFKEYILPWIQIPLWVSVSLALRNMAGALPVEGVGLPVLCPDLATGGALWFSNLLLPDSTLLLPFVMCLTNLIIIEMHHLRIQTPTRMQRSITYAFRGLMVILFPIAANIPSCMCFYWTCSSLYGLGQNILLRLPRVRRMLGIPKTPSESSTPFKDLVAVANERYSFKKWKRRPSDKTEKKP